MPKASSDSLLQYLRVLAVACQTDPRSDAELLARFVEAHDERAFTALVARHGPLVWRVCQALLKSGPEAEDAFQVTFLLLARRAGKSGIETLAGWLHRVARQTALKLRAGAARQRRIGAQLGERIRSEAAQDCQSAELYALLEEELASLPERLRVPLVLRYLEGKTLAEVARILGCSLTPVTKRLARGEAILRERLERRGIVVGVVSVGALLGSTATVSAVPARLIGQTARAAVAFRSGTLTGGAVEAARAVAGAFPTSLGTALPRKSLWIVLACVGSLGVGLAAWQASSPRSEAVETPESAASPQAAAEPSGEGVDRFGDPLPQGALARLGTVRLRHVGRFGFDRQGAESVVFSPDGKVLLTGGPGNPIRLWDTATGKLLRSFDAHRVDPMQSLILSPDGRTVATLEHCRGSLWEVATGKLLYPLESAVHTIGFARDGRLLSADSHFCVWETATGKILRNQPLLDAEKVERVASLFSPDGKTFALISNDDKTAVVHLWETATGKKLHHLSLGKGAILQRSVAFSRDGRFLAVGRAWHHEGSVHLLEVATGKEVKEVRKWTSDQREPYSVAFSPDGKILATGSGFGSIRLWHTATGKELRQCQGYRAHVVALAFSPDGRTLASLAGLHDHTASLWDVASGKERLRTSGGHVGPVLSVAFLADGKSVISGGRDGLVGFWNAETGQEQRPPLRAGDFQALAAFAPDGKTVLTVGNVFSPTLQDLKSVALETPSLVCVWDRATGQKLREFKGPEGAAQSLTLSPDGKVLLWTSWNRVHLIDVATGKTMRAFPGTFEPKCAAFSPDGKTLAVYVSENGRAGGNATIHFHETATGKELSSIQAPGTQPQPWCPAFSPDGQTFALGGMKGKEGTDLQNCPIRLWRTQRGKKDWKEVGKFVGHRDEVWALTFSPDGKTLASASKDGTLRLWEVATGQERRRFAGHGGSVWCLAFAPDGRRLAAGGDDTTILVWDVTGRLQNGQLRPVKLSAQEVKSLWADLAGADAARAGRAIWTLAAAPAQALPLLKDHLRSVAPAGPRIARLIVDLDSDDFVVRQRATDELAKLGEVADPALRQGLAKSSSLEMRRRLEQLLELTKETFPLSIEKLRSCRALEVLDQMNTPEALALLESLAQGAPEARQTLAAQAIVRRLRTQVKVAQP